MHSKLANLDATAAHFGVDPSLFDYAVGLYRSTDIFPFLRFDPADRPLAVYLDQTTGSA